jgi:hypothetical protein
VFAFASGLIAVARFFELLAAGFDVALQSFILSAVGYFGSWAGTGFESGIKCRYRA